MTANGNAHPPELARALDDERQRRTLAEAENQRLSQELLKAEQERQELLNLYVASRRLHASLDKDDVLAGIQEIVINIIGSEELGVYEVSEDRKSLRLISAFGLDDAALQRITLGKGPIGEAAQKGEPVLADEPGKVTAVVPLKVGDDLIGALAVFRLLPQKTGLSPNDRELFEILRTNGALALHTATRRSGGDGESKS